MVLLSLCPDVFVSKQESEFFEITVSHESLELVLLWVKYGRDDISVRMARGMMEIPLRMVSVVVEGVAMIVANGRAEGVKMGVAAEGVAMGLAKGEAIEISVAKGMTEGFTMDPAEDSAIDISVGVPEAEGVAIDIFVAEGMPMGLAEGVPMGVSEGFTMGPAEDVAIDISVGVAEGVAIDISVAEGMPIGPAQDVAIEISVGVAEGMAEGVTEGVALAENMDTFVRNNFLKKVFDLR